MEGGNLRTCTPNIDIIASRGFDIPRDGVWIEIGLGRPWSVEWSCHFARGTGYIHYFVRKPTRYYGDSLYLKKDPGGEWHPKRF